MNFNRIFVCKTENDTQKFACAFANIVQKGDILALYGTLGVGKSTFSRYFIQFLCGVQDVPSPTFTLVQTYETENFDIYHYDMYRLKHQDEAYELGIEESFFNGVNLIEWPEKIESILPRNIWKINIAVKDGIRYFDVEVTSDKKALMLAEISYA